MFALFYVTQASLDVTSLYHFIKMHGINIAKPQPMFFAYCDRQFHSHVKD